MNQSYSHPYWLDVPALRGETSSPKDGQICIVGSGLSGVSAAYWLLEKGFEDVVLVDSEPNIAATFRNCGHILYGTVESMHALTAPHGEAKAAELWRLSIEICHEVRDTIARLALEADYRQDGYLVMAIDEHEDKEIQNSIELLAKHGFESSYRSRKELEQLGFRHVYGGRYEPGSAQAHPSKFRNGLLAHCLARGLRYHSGFAVTSVEEKDGKVCVSAKNHRDCFYEAAVIAANAYSPLLSKFFAEHKLVDPFRGQIICSKPLAEIIPISYPHSFDHGYEYALRTPDNRLMIGGWRNHTPHGEVGTYDIGVNPDVEEGLKEFVRKHYALKDEPEWEYSWSGIMAASKTGFPFIGPTNSPRIYTVAGYTGHGFSWAHGSAKILADIINGDSIPAIVAQAFIPR